MIGYQQGTVSRVIQKEQKQLATRSKRGARSAYRDTKQCSRLRGGLGFFRPHAQPPPGPLRIPSSSGVASAETHPIQSVLFRSLSRVLFTEHMNNTTTKSRLLYVNYFGLIPLYLVEGSSGNEKLLHGPCGSWVSNFP